MAAHQAPADDAVQQRVFISHAGYCNGRLAQGGALAEELQRCLWRECCDTFVDWRDIKTGDEWRATLKNAAATSRVLLAVLTWVSALMGPEGRCIGLAGACHAFPRLGCSGCACIAWVAAALAAGMDLAVLA
jgi:hypothetical protein